MNRTKRYLTRGQPLTRVHFRLTPEDARLYAAAKARLEVQQERPLSHGHVIAALARAALGCFGVYVR